jgi:hypothetical protein
MKAEIKEAIESMADALVKGIGAHLKGEEIATIEEIKERNINITLLKINSLQNKQTPKKNDNFR